VVLGRSVHRARTGGPCGEPVPDAKGELYVERFAHASETPVGRDTKTVSRVVFKPVLYRISFLGTPCVVGIGCRNTSK